MGNKTVRTYQGEELTPEEFDARLKRAMVLIEAAIEEEMAPGANLTGPSVDPEIEDWGLSLLMDQTAKPWGRKGPL